MEIAEITEELLSLSDKSGHVADFSLSLNPTSSKMLGVKVPHLRNLAKKIAKDDYKKFLKENPLDNFEMEMLQAMVIGYAKDDVEQILAQAAAFIPKIHDWAVNDAFCQTFKIARNFPEKIWNFLMTYAESRNEFEVRVVAVMILSHFLNETYIERAISVLDSLYTGKTRSKNDFYYAKMGVAWAIAEAAAKSPEKCFAYMSSKENHLDNWTYNKAIQKMKESFRVSDEMKMRMEKLKR